MKIKKLDDRPMTIHTKEKPKIHFHNPKSAKAKEAKPRFIMQSAKTAGTKTSPKGAAARQKRKPSRKTTAYQTHTKESSILRISHNIRESNTSIKVKDRSLHIAGRPGALAAGTLTSQVEGGQEFSQAAYLAYEASRPVAGTASKGAKLFKKKAEAQIRRRIKKVEAGKKLGKKTAKKAAKDTAKTAAKETAKESAKLAAKATAKTATKVAATAAGTAAAPGVGTAAGIAAGYLSGVAIEAKDAQITNRNRKIKFFLDKTKPQEKQTDSVAKLVRDLAARKALLWVKTAGPVAGLVLLLLTLVAALVAVIVMAVTAILYNSPFALFLPPLEPGDTVQSVTSAYVSEFHKKVADEAASHTGYDAGEVIYVDYEGTETAPSNYYDIMAVYMVKYGIGDMATVMNDTTKGWLLGVCDDMCSYTVTGGTEEVEGTDGEGNTVTTQRSVRYVNVTLKSYRDMIPVYGFGPDEVELLGQVMSADFMGQLGWNGGGGGSSGGGSSSPGKGSLTEAEVSEILGSITDPAQRAACSYALHRVGYPYSQDLRDSGSYYDCSSLAYYSWKDAGVDISFGGATTAAAEAQGLEEAKKTVPFGEMQPGDLIFYSFTNNKRYKNISHVAVYVGDGKVVEALNERVGVVYREVSSIGSIVLIGRP